MQRVEIITGKERRRRWSDEDKRRLAEEAFQPGAIVAHVARRHEVAESCLYAWRKRFIEKRGEAVSNQPQLIPVVVDAAPAMQPRPDPMTILSRHAVVTLPDGTRLEVAAGYPASALKALIAALRQAR